MLPEVIRPGLRAVFCGTAVGSASATRGAYYAGAGNKFWPTLYETGLTPRQLDPEEFQSLLDWDLGLTDLSKCASGSDLEVGMASFDVDRLARLVRDNAPTVIAFNGMKAGRASLGCVDDYGRQPVKFGDAEAWVLPSTSGAANRWWDFEPWQAPGRRLR